MPAPLPGDHRNNLFSHAYRAVLLILVAVAAVLGGFGVREIYRSSQKVTNQTNGIIVYLDCVGHLPIVNRQQKDVDKCLDKLRKAARGEL